VRLLDSRRLTGPNLIWERPGAVIDVAFGDEDPDLVVGAWRREAQRLLAEVGWHDEQTCVRRFEGGANLAISAPVDVLYTAVDLNETAWDAARDLIQGGHRHLLTQLARQLRRDIREEERPRLRRLMAVARERGIPVVLDTDEVSLGYGCRSETWDLREVPHPDDVDWENLGDIPLALVTGTNGKTTTVRLMAAIGRCAGLVTGVSSTDWLGMGEEIVERSDFAGPQGARRILRDRRCQLAVLETARGGLLRRGLAVDRADAALITNIASDHLGEFGVQTVEQLVDVKWVVSRAVADGGTLVLNAGDPLLVERAPEASARILWFDVDPDNPLLREHLAAGGTVCTLNRGRIVLRDGDQALKVVTPVQRIPICFGGAAKHNVANALGATALAYALGIAPEAIAEGLCSLQVEDNPGRANLYDIGGVKVLLDFAHNPHGLEAMIDMVKDLPAERRLLIIGQAGDRSDQDIRDFARAAEGLSFDRILIKRLPGHNRGRADGEVAELLQDEFSHMGYQRRQMALHSEELGSVRAALRWARPGDLIVFLAHEDKRAATDLLSRLRDEKAGARAGKKGKKAAGKAGRKKAARRGRKATASARPNHETGAGVEAGAGAGADGDAGVC
jgi:cyanophycin synthetase